MEIVDIGSTRVVTEGGAEDVDETDGRIRYERNGEGGGLGVKRDVGRGEVTRDDDDGIRVRCNFCWRLSNRTRRKGSIRR